MKVLCLGDIFGKSGREAIFRDLPEFKKNNKIDFVIANAENAAHGFGITEKIALSFLEDNLIDVLTIGDHAINRRENPIGHPRIVNAGNYQNEHFGTGYTLVEKNGQTLAIMCLLGQVFIESERKHISNPFEKIDSILAELSGKADAFILDFHAEATGEKQAMAFYVEARIAAMFGTHTHVPTADAQIYPKGMGYITDVGMCGNYNSVIGADPTRALTHHLPNIARTHLQPQEGKGFLSGVIFTIETNRCMKVETLLPPFRIK